MSHSQEAPASASQGERGLSLSLYLTMGALSAMAPLVTDFYLPGMPEMAKTLHTTDGLAQLTMSVNLIGLAIGQLYVGVLSDRIGRRMPLLACLVLFVLTTALCAIAPDIWFLLVARFVQGLFAAGTLVVSRAAVRDLCPPRMAAKVYSQLMTVFLVAPIVAPILGGQIMRFSSWRGVFWALALVGVALLVASYVVMKESLAPEDRHPTGAGQFRQMAGLLRGKSFRAYVLMSGLQSATLFAYISMSGFFFHDKYDVGPQEYSALFALNAVGMVIGSQINARFVHQHGPMRMMRIMVPACVVACTVLLVVVLLDSPLFLIAGTLFFVLLTMSPSMPNATALAMAPMGNSAGAAAALMGASGFLIGATIPALVSQLSTSGIAMAITMLVSFLLVGALTVYVGRHHVEIEPHVG